MINKIKVVTFLLAFVVGSFLFLDKAYAQVVGYGQGGHPVCPNFTCAGDFETCDCEEECFFGTVDPSTAVGCIGVSFKLGFLSCVSGCPNAEDVSDCVATCRTSLDICVENC
jgi:hypothetical protein